MPRILRNTAGRILRMASGKLASDGCAPACCGGGQTCAHAILCWNTPGYDDVEPKVLVFPCPEGGVLCTNPPGPRLIAYRGYCYELLVNEDGTLQCDSNCGSNGGSSVYVADPDAEFTCLEPGQTCLDSPCADDFHPAECCERRPLLCNSGCGCTGTEICDCGKRFIAFTWGYERYQSWNVQYATQYGRLTNDRMTTRRASWVMTYYGSVGSGGACSHYEIRPFGGTRVLWYHGTPEYGEDYTADDFTPWTAGYGCWEAWQAAIRRAPGSGECAGSFFRACTSQIGGEQYEYTGQTRCDGAEFGGFIEKKHPGDCIVSERWDWESYVFIQRLVECDPEFAGQPPSIAELGLF